MRLLAVNNEMTTMMKTVPVMKIFSSFVRSITGAYPARIILPGKYLTFAAIVLSVFRASYHANSRIFPRVSHAGFSTILGRCIPPLRVLALS